MGLHHFAGNDATVQCRAALHSTAIAVAHVEAMTWLSILGIGEDGIDGMSPAARDRLQAATLVVGGKRHLALARRPARSLAWPSPMEAAFPTILAARGQPTVVLASGDPFCFGIGSKLAALVTPDEMICLPAPSAFSLACARLGWALQAVATISFCGRPLAAILPLLQPNRQVLALSADAETPAALAALLHANGFGPSRMLILQALGGPDERIVTTIATGFDAADVNRLNLVAIEVIAAPGARIIPLSPGLPETLFEHDGQITKREIRALTLAALAPRAGEHLWDIGCGSGSVAIEWMLRHNANSADAIERDPVRAARARRNADTLGVPGLRVHQASAPAGLAGLKQPDAVFIGGGATQALVDLAWSALPPGGRLVINAVTLETARLLYDLPARLGGALTRIAVERLEPVGTMHGFRPAMAVTQFAATRP